MYHRFPGILHTLFLGQVIIEDVYYTCA